MTQSKSLLFPLFAQSDAPTQLVLAATIIQFLQSNPSGSEISLPLIYNATTTLFGAVNEYRKRHGLYLTTVLHDFLKGSNAFHFDLITESQKVDTLVDNCKSFESADSLIFAHANEDLIDEISKYLPTELQQNVAIYEQDPSFIKTAICKEQFIHDLWKIPLSKDNACIVQVDNQVVALFYGHGRYYSYNCESSLLHSSEQRLELLETLSDTLVTDSFIIELENNQEASKIVAYAFDPQLVELLNEDKYIQELKAEWVNRFSARSVVHFNSESLAGFLNVTRKYQLMFLSEPLYNNHTMIMLAAAGNTKLLNYLLNLVFVTVDETALSILSLQDTNGNTFLHLIPHSEFSSLQINVPRNIVIGLLNIPNREQKNVFEQVLSDSLTGTKRLIEWVNSLEYADGQKAPVVLTDTAGFIEKYQRNNRGDNELLDGLEILRYFSLENQKIILTNLLIKLVSSHQREKYALIINKIKTYDEGQQFDILNHTPTVCSPFMYAAVKDNGALRYLVNLMTNWCHDAQYKTIVQHDKAGKKLLEQSYQHNPIGFFQILLLVSHWNDESIKARFKASFFPSIDSFIGTLVTIDPSSIEKTALEQSFRILVLVSEKTARTSLNLSFFQQSSKESAQFLKLIECYQQERILDLNADIYREFPLKEFYEWSVKEYYRGINIIITTVHDQPMECAPEHSDYLIPEQQTRARYYVRGKVFSVKYASSPTIRSSVCRPAVGFAVFLNTINAQIRGTHRWCVFPGTQYILLVIYD